MSDAAAQEQPGSSSRNPTWVRDELILALDMYLRFGGNPPGKDSAEILELSDTLNRLGHYLGLSRRDRFRNTNGVYMKLMNFRRFDPTFTDAGRVGLSRGGRHEADVWARFAHDPAQCFQVASAIREALSGTEETEGIGGPTEDDIEDAEEGRVLTGLHRRYERRAAIVKAKKARALTTAGRLACEACGFDFGERYGEHGTGFIECHHTRPVHTLQPGEKTKLADLKLLCANCHRMVHAKRPWLSMEQLVAILRPGL
jgi:5-methylcytosine-specific restriction protein A